MSDIENQVPMDPMVDTILELAQRKRSKELKQIRNLIYEPFRSRYHPILFRLLPDKEAGVAYYSLRQAYRLIGPLMAGYPRMTRVGNFGHSLGQLERVIGQSVAERKLLIIRQSLKLHWAESTLLRLVTLMQDNNILINWDQLLLDARYWNKTALNKWYEDLYSVRKREEVAK